MYAASRPQYEFRCWLSSVPARQCQATCPHTCRVQRQTGDLSPVAQEKLAELKQLQREVQVAREKGIATPSVLRSRAAAAEEAFLGLAAALLEAPDPVPLLHANAAITRSAAGAELPGAVYGYADFRIWDGIKLVWWVKDHQLEGHAANNFVAVDAGLDSIGLKGTNSQHAGGGAGVWATSGTKLGFCRAHRR